METKTQHPKGNERVISVLNGFIVALDLAKEASSIVLPQVKGVFASASFLIASIRVRPLLVLYW